MKRNVIILAVCQALMMSGNALLITATALVGLQIAPEPQWATVPFALMFVGVIATTYPASLMMEEFSGLLVRIDVTSWRRRQWEA